MFVRGFIWLNNKQAYYDHCNGWGLISTGRQPTLWWYSILPLIIISLPIWIWFTINDTKVGGQTVLAKRGQPLSSSILLSHNTSLIRKNRIVPLFCPAFSIALDAPSLKAQFSPADIDIHLKFVLSELALYGFEHINDSRMAQSNLFRILWPLRNR